MSILKCAWRLYFTFFEIFLLIFKIGRKLLFSNGPEPLKTIILKYLEKIVKKFQKYKIWSPSTFQYKYLVERFRLTIWSLKMEILA